MTQRLRGALFLLVAMLLGACATVPSLDQEMLRTGRAPTVVIKGAHGPLSHAQSEKILADLKKRSPETSIFDSHVAVEEALAGNTLSVGNRAVLLENGKATYASMLQAIRGARDHIHLESYIFEGDEVGQEFAQALAERRRAGVQVRVLYDAVGSLDTPREFFDGLRAQGVEVVAYNPLSATTVLTDATRLNHRDHRKLTIVDGRVAFLGGINISSVYTGSSSSGGSGTSGASKPKPKQPFDTPWRDTQVRLEGPVVADLQRAFIANWQSQSKQKLEGAGLFPKLQPQGHDLVRAIPASPDMGPNPLYVALISAIESADTAVNLTNAYFVPHVELLAALKAAARRGVRVRIILPSRTDSWLVFNAGRSFYDEMLEAGIQVFERRDRLLHSKTASIDGVWATVGSTNLDWRSLVFNDELNAVVLGPEFAAQLDAAFEQDIAHSQAITLAQWEHRPLADRMRELVARTWAHML